RMSQGIGDEVPRVRGEQLLSAPPVDQPTRHLGAVTPDSLSHLANRDDAAKVLTNPIRVTATGKRLELNPGHARSEVIVIARMCAYHDRIRQVVRSPLRAASTVEPTAK